MHISNLTNTVKKVGDDINRVQQHSISVNMQVMLWLGMLVQNTGQRCGCTYVKI